MQTLAGVLLPSATVFLLLLCNDRAVLGPWVNARVAEPVHRRGDRRSGAAVDDPDRRGAVPRAIVRRRSSGSSAAARRLALVAALASGALKRPAEIDERKVWNREMWRMPKLSELGPARLSRASRIWMAALRLYLVLAGGLVLARIVMLAIAG